MKSTQNMNTERAALRSTGWLGRWRLVPKIRFVNYRKEFPNMGSTAFAKWFYAERRWSGRIINIGVKAWAVVLDFRKDWIADMKAP